MCINIKKYQSFLSENLQFLEVKFSIYLNRRVFVMEEKTSTEYPLILHFVSFCYLFMGLYMTVCLKLTLVLLNKLRSHTLF